MLTSVSMLLTPSLPRAVLIKAFNLRLRQSVYIGPNGKEEGGRRGGGGDRLMFDGSLLHGGDPHSVWLCNLAKKKSWHTLIVQSSPLRSKWCIFVSMRVWVSVCVYVYVRACVCACVCVCVCIKEIVIHEIVLWWERGIVIVVVFVVVVCFVKY